MKNRLFFFGSWASAPGRRRPPRPLPPTAAERAGDFTASNPAPNDPLNNNQPFPGRIIPQTRLDPVALKLLEKASLPNDPSGRLSVLASSPSTGDNAIGKFDYMASTKDRLNFRYYFDYRRGVDAFPVLDSPGWILGGYAPNRDATEVQSYALNHLGPGRQICWCPPAGRSLARPLPARIPCARALRIWARKTSSTPPARPVYRKSLSTAASAPRRAKTATGPEIPTISRRTGRGFAVDMS